MPARLTAVLLLVVAAGATVVALIADVFAPGPAYPVTLQATMDVIALMWALAGFAVATRRPRHVLGWLLLVQGALTQVSIAEEALVRGGVIGTSVAGLGLTVVVGTGIYLMYGLLPLLYPSGRLPSRRWWPLAAILAVASIGQLLQWLMSRVAGWRWPFDEGQAAQATWLEWTPFGVYAVAAVLGWVLCLVRIAQAASPERAQLVLLLGAVVLPLGVSAALAGSESVLAMWVTTPLMMLLPVAVAVGVLRYRLLGIEVVLHRGLVYGALTACVVAVYALVTWVGARVGGEAVPPVLAAALVAVGLLPLRGVMQGWVDRLLYGGPNDPLATVSALGTVVAGVPAPSVADQLAESMRHAVRSRGVRVERPDGTFAGSAGTVDDDPATLRIPLTVGGLDVGVLVVGPRALGERYRPADVRLLHALAPQAAVALHAVDVAEELQRQRDRVVAVRGEERDRLRHDVHDGLGPSLTGVGLGLRAIDDAAAAGDIDRIRSLTSRVRTEIDRSVHEVRRILDDLRPERVQREGLALALQQAFGHHPGPPAVDVQVIELPALPAAVEDATYRVALEAATNAVRHSGAGLVRVRVRGDASRLVLEVVEDGCGIPQDVVTGVGLASMRRRASAVGGNFEIITGARADEASSDRTGTTIRFTVPLKQPVTT
jgi:signal transduction histidine kinase